MDQGADMDKEGREDTGAHPIASNKVDVEVLAKLSRETGQVPIPIQVMAMRPGVASAHIAYRDQVFEGGPLSAKERALVQLTAAVALRLGDCIAKLAANAKKAGVSQDEIVQATLIASMQAGSSMLHTAHGGITAQPSTLQAGQPPKAT
jgi:alkylhydroperoxidase/carboxymuconolactone decarboxylase family protein YurZ